MKKLVSVLLVMFVVASVFAVGSVKVGGTFGFDVGKSVGTDFDDAGAEKLFDASYKVSGFGFSVDGSYDVAEKLDVFADFTMLFCLDPQYKGDYVEEMLGETKYVKFFKEYEDEFVDSVKALIATTNAGGLATIDTYDKENLSVNYSNLNYSFAAGVTYDLPLNLPVEVRVGGGLFLERILSSGKYSYVDEDGITVSPDKYDAVLKHEVYQKMVNIGLTALVEAEYSFAEDFGVVLSLMPRLGLYNGSYTKMVVEQTDFVDPEKTTTTTYVDNYAGAFRASFSMPISVGVVYKF
ncbi:MAG: hypothetical protein K6F82_05955 [Sphaerochaetaceae bacterium]|nr:hypothetical protein [Sphaerochaetaceae bacterium]